MVTLCQVSGSRHARSVHESKRREQALPESRPIAQASPVARHLVSLTLALVVAVAAVGLSTSPGRAAAAPDRAEQLRFMWAMAGQESGWDYYARNGASGAFGRYQIMPFNWPVWARQYLGDGRADQTPYNQEVVAFGKLHDLYGWLGSWKRVAYWWLTGSSEKNEKKWSGYAKGYVSNIMRLRRKAPPNGAPLPPRTSSRADSGDWRRSGLGQKLRSSVRGNVWSARGWVRGGEVLKVRSVKALGSGRRWIQVVTVDGRLGWLRQPSTVPAHKPSAARLWNDVRDEGRPVDRKAVRPRPR
jgi:hypothetical protein